MKYALPGGNTFTEDLDKLKKALDTLSFTLTGETFLAVLGISDQLTNMNAKKTVQNRRDSRNKAIWINPKDITWIEDKPFAFGSFGSIYRVLYERRITVAKMIDLKDVPQKSLEATIKEYKKEVALMGELRSQNTVQILGAVVNPSELIILMEYCEGGDLRTRLDSALEGKIVFDHAKAINILLDIAFGMKYLHNR